MVLSTHDRLMRGATAASGATLGYIVGNIPGAVAGAKLGAKVYDLRKEIQEEKKEYSRFSNTVLGQMFDEYVNPFGTTASAKFIQDIYNDAYPEAPARVNNWDEFEYRDGNVYQSGPWSAQGPINFAAYPEPPDMQEMEVGVGNSGFGAPTAIPNATPNPTPTPNPNPNPTPNTDPTPTPGPNPRGGPGGGVKPNEVMAAGIEFTSGLMDVFKDQPRGDLSGAAKDIDAMNAQTVQDLKNRSDPEALAQMADANKDFISRNREVPGGSQVNFTPEGRFPNTTQYDKWRLTNEIREYIRNLPDNEKPTDYYVDGKINKWYEPITTTTKVDGRGKTYTTEENREYMPEHLAQIQRDNDIAYGVLGAAADLIMPGPKFGLLKFGSGLAARVLPKAAYYTAKNAPGLYKAGMAAGRFAGKIGTQFGKVGAKLGDKLAKIPTYFKGVGKKVAPRKPSYDIQMQPVSQVSKKSDSFSPWSSARPSAYSSASSRASLVKVKPPKKPPGRRKSDPGPKKPPKKYQTSRNSVGGANKVRTPKPAGRKLSFTDLAKDSAKSKKDPVKDYFDGLPAKGKSKKDPVKDYFDGLPTKTTTKKPPPARRPSDTTNLKGPSTKLLGGGAKKMTVAQKVAAKARNLKKAVTKVGKAMKGKGKDSSYKKFV